MQRLLFVQRAQHLDGGLQGGQLAVGIEDVELAVVLAEGRAGVGGAVVAAAFIEALAFAHGQRFDGLEQRVAVVGEVVAAP